ncbi:U-box domain-containing protein [Poronia punctata]|nr:U-box domain-containing protein [Poronia punctata]
MRVQDLPPISGPAEEDMWAHDTNGPTSDGDSGDNTPTSSVSSLTFDNDDVSLTIHPVENGKGVLLSVRPPVEPSDPSMDHVPCDIVLVIDVSGSMAAAALAPPNEKQGKDCGEDYGLTALDLTKHAARTIMATLNENDRLGIVTFSFDAEVVQPLVPMSDTAKREADIRISNMYPDGPTHLWAGVKEGIRQLESEDSGDRVQALMVLTDGQPTQQVAQGYVKKIRNRKDPKPLTINTFGFGYGIQSDLLKSIAEAGNGNYAFIPDAGMIGTVFVHAVAHLQTTYAIDCSLSISAPPGMKLKTTSGKSLDGEERAEMLKLNLGNLQYGQSRDIYLECTGKGAGNENGTISAILTHTQVGPGAIHVPLETSAQQDISSGSHLAKSVIAYHRSRSQICQLLSSFLELDDNSQYRVESTKGLVYLRKKLDTLIRRIPAREHRDRGNRALLKDLNGQITTALSSEEYFRKWGVDYFLSLWNAHSMQLRNSFKDPGPQMYNKNKFFLRCRDTLDDAFDGLPAPTPSRARPGRSVVVPHMSRFNDVNGACFDESSPVRLASGEEVSIGNLSSGTAVRTPVGPRRVRAVLRTAVIGMPMCRVGRAIATHWHPVRMPEKEGPTAGTWAFPIDLAKDKRRLDLTGDVYSVLLEPSSDPDAHAIEIGGVWGVTLGHGILAGDDVRAHKFLGNYDAVVKELKKLVADRKGVHLSVGVKRDAETGKVCGFLPKEFTEYDYEYYADVLSGGMAKESERPPNSSLGCREIVNLLHT